MFSLCSKTLLFSLGGSFLYYADHFKHYSGFCANHIKVQKVLERGEDRPVCSKPEHPPQFYICSSLQSTRPISNH